MLLDLNGNTLAGVKLTLGMYDRVSNGTLDHCVVVLPRLIKDTSKVFDGVQCIACDVTYEKAGIDLVLQHADGTKSLAEIATLLKLQHSQVRDIITTHRPEYYKARTVYKLQQTLDLDLAIAALSPKLTQRQACAAFSINSTTHRERVRKYKEHGLWPV